MKEILRRVMDPDLLETCPDEWGIVLHCPAPKGIGFATTLTPAIIHQAISKGLDLLVTHHDAWEFMLDECSESHELLAQHKISHIWCHQPLDRCDYGPAAALLSMIGCEVIGNIAEDGGRVGEWPSERELSLIIEMLDARMSERPCRVHDASKQIRRIACVPGGGMPVDYLVEALEFGVDLYITGETSLYLLEYARFRNVSVLIYSHNYTEILGTQNLARKIADRLGIEEIVRLDEPHF